MKQTLRGITGLALVVALLAQPVQAAETKSETPQENKPVATNTLTAIEYKLVNKSIARTIAWPDGKLATKSIENLLAGQTYALGGEEFEIRLDGVEKPITAASAKVTGAETQSIEGGKRLVVSLTDPALAGATLRVVYELKDADFFGRKWIEIDPPEGKKLPVASLSVELLKFPAKATCTFSKAKQKGQPVYIDDNLFLGLEWPSAANTFDKALYSATHWPAWDVEKGFCSKHAVWGAAPAGEVGHWFTERYVSAMRMTPPSALRVMHEPYYSGELGFNLAVFQKRVADYRDNLLKKYGVQIDNYGITLAWWGGGPDIFEPKSPEGFKTAQKTLQTELPGCNIGFYWPFAGTALNMDPVITKKYGYETTGDAYCTVGPIFAKSAQEKIQHNMADLGVNYFQDDNYKVRPCKVAGHGHRTEGGAALESQVEGLMRFARFIKSLNPKAFIQQGFVFDLPSPWLLANGYDSVGLQGSGAEAAASAGFGFRRERWINAYDVGLSTTCLKLGMQTPPSAIASALIFKRKSFDKQTRPLAEWEHDVLMCAGRGGLSWGLALHGDEMSDGEWAFLAKTINWTRDNVDVLANNTRFLLGKVQADEPYGYSHAKDNRCIVFLRNPGLPGALDLKNGWKFLPAAKEDDIPKEFAASAFDDGAWQKVDELGKYKPSATDGYLLYRCRFKAPVEWKGKRVTLFGLTGSLDIDKDVFLNGNPLPAEVGGLNGGDVSGAFAYGAENLVAVRCKLNSRNKFAKGISGPVKVACLDNEQTVPFTLDAATSGFDPKYKRAIVKWVYPEGRTDPKTLEVGKACNFAMKPFDVLVFELKLE